MIELLSKKVGVFSNGFPTIVRADARRFDALIRAERSIRSIRVAR